MRCPSLLPLLAFAAGIGAASFAGHGPAETVVAETARMVHRPAGAMPGSFAAGVLRVVDGDTLEARVAVWPGQEIVTLVRLAGVDAPELDGRCAAERRAAAAAREALSRLVGNGAVVLSDVRPDKYFGRVVARVAGADGRDFGQVLGEAGHVRPYEGGRRLSWCEAGPVAAGKAAPARKHDSLSAQRL